MKNRENQSIQNGHITRDVNAGQRAALALELRTQKMKYDDIAKRCGYGSAGAAHKAVQREMQRTIVINVEELRREELNFLDMLTAECLKKMQDKANKDPLWAVDRLIKISDQRARLMGLEIPTNNNIAIGQAIIREVPAGYLGIVEAPKP